MGIENPPPPPPPPTDEQPPAGNNCIYCCFQPAPAWIWLYAWGIGKCVPTAPGLGSNDVNGWFKLRQQLNPCLYSDLLTGDPTWSVMFQAYGTRFTCLSGILSGFSAYVGVSADRADNETFCPIPPLAGSWGSGKARLFLNPSLVGVPLLNIPAAAGFDDRADSLLELLPDAETPTCLRCVNERDKTNFKIKLEE